VVPWNQLEAPRLLRQLLDEGARVRTSRKAFTAETANGLQSFQRGALVIQSGIQDEDRRDGVFAVLNAAALGGIVVHSLETTLTPSGPDLGAGHFPLVEPVRPLLLVGGGVSSYDSGTAWHLLDQRLGMATPFVEQQHFDRVELRDFTHLVMADGRYEQLTEADRERIKRWVTAGGMIIASGRAATWAENLCFDDGCEDEAVRPAATAPGPRTYADFADDHAKLVIGGAIVATMADLSHPLAWGLQRPELPLFRQGTTLLRPSDNPYVTPVRYSDEPLLAGFIGQQRQDEMRGQPAVIAERQGDGLVVRFANTPLFRGFWRGTEKLFVNALFFGQTVQSTTLPRVTGAPIPEPERSRQ
jgi:hypothetical protein